MLSLPDFKEKKIVLIPLEDTLDNQLKLSNNNICLYREGKLVNKVSCSIVFSILVLGDCTLSTKLLEQLKRHGISITILNYSFKELASIMAIAEGNTNLRLRQYTSSDETNLLYAQSLVANKIRNQFSLLHMKKKNVDATLLKTTLSQINRTTNRNILMGIEGNVSALYFSALFGEIGWYRRAPRTKQDIANLLLDIGYTQLFNFTDALLRLFGFDTYKGFYHQLFFQRKSLTCDLVEPFRPLIDKQLVKMYNLNQINNEDFIFSNGFYRFKEYKAQKSYVNPFFETLTKNKEKIYKYMHGYYRHVQNPTVYKFPEYKLS